MINDINKVTQGLNDICVDTGVCPPKSTIYLAALTKDSKYWAHGTPVFAAELKKEGSEKTVRVICYQDNVVTSCVIDEKNSEPSCYSSEKGGMELTEAWVKHLKENGYKVIPEK